MNPKMHIQDLGGGGLKECVGQPFWPGSTNHISGVEKKSKNTKKVLFLLLILVLREPIEDPAHYGRWYQGWSGRWCFSQHLEGEWRLGCPAQHHKQGVHSNIRAITEYLRKYMAAPKEVQIIILRSTIQPIWEWKVAPKFLMSWWSLLERSKDILWWQ